MRYKYLLFSIFFAISAKAISQTCIIVARTKDSIILGADTRTAIPAYGISPYTHKDTSGYIWETLPKIGHYGQIFFSITGFGYFEVFDLALNSCIIGHNLRASILYFKNNIRKVTDSVLYNFNKDRSLSNSEKGHLNYLDAVFCGFEDGIPKVFRYQLHVLSKKKIYGYNYKDTLVDILALPESKTGLPFPQCFPLGLYDAIHDDIFVSKDWMLPLGYQIGEINLIKKQAEHTPTFVGEPIDVVTIKKDGYNWYEPKRSKFFKKNQFR